MSAQRFRRKKPRANQPRLTDLPPDVLAAIANLVPNRNAAALARTSRAARSATALTLKRRGKTAAEKVEALKPMLDDVVAVVPALHVAPLQSFPPRNQGLPATRLTVTRRDPLALDHQLQLEGTYGQHHITITRHADDSHPGEYIVMGSVKRGGKRVASFFSGYGSALAELSAYQHKDDIAILKRAVKAAGITRILVSSGGFQRNPPRLSV